MAPATSFSGIRAFLEGWVSPWQVRGVAWVIAGSAAVYAVVAGEPAALFLSGLAVLIGEGLSLLPRNHQRLRAVADRYGLHVVAEQDPVGVTATPSPALEPRGRVRAVHYAAQGVIDGRDAAVLRYANSPESARHVAGTQIQMLWIAALRLPDAWPAVTIRQARWGRRSKATAGRAWRVDGDDATAGRLAQTPAVADAIDQVVDDGRSAVVVDGEWVMVVHRPGGGRLADIDRDVVRPARRLAAAITAGGG